MPVGKERYIVKVARVLSYEGEVEVDATDPAHARHLANDRATDLDFPWRQTDDDVKVGAITIPEEQPRRRRR
jgi:hypothetical protein